MTAPFLATRTSQDGGTIAGEDAGADAAREAVVSLAEEGGKYTPVRVIPVSRLRAFILAGCFALAAIAGVLVYWEREEKLDAATTQLLSAAEISAQFAMQSVAAADAVLRTVVERVELAAPTSDDALAAAISDQSLFEFIQRRALSLPQIGVISITAANGQLLNFSRGFPAPPINLSDRDYFQAHLNEPALELFISEPVQNRGNGAWSFFLARKVRDANGRLLGVVLAGLQVSFYRASFAAWSNGPAHAFSLLRRAGVLLARHPESSIGLSYAATPAFTDIINRSDKGAVSTRVDSPTAIQRERIIAAAAAPGYNLVVTLVGYTDSILRPWRAQAQLIGVGAFALALIAAFAYWRAGVSVRSLDKGGEEVGPADSPATRAQDASPETPLAENKANFLDPLTGLPTSEYLRAYLERAQAQNRQAPIRLVLVDLQCFSLVNKVLGYEKGDAILSEFAEFLWSKCRPVDLVARIGGDEFAVIFQDVSPEAGPGLVARLSGALAQKEFEGMKLTLPWGETPACDAGDLDAMLRLARRDMAVRAEQAKRA